MGTARNSRLVARPWCRRSGRGGHRHRLLRTGHRRGRREGAGFATRVLLDLTAGVAPWNPPRRRSRTCAPPASRSRVRHRVGSRIGGGVGRLPVHTGLTLPRERRGRPLSRTWSAPATAADGCGLEGADTGAVQLERIPDSSRLLAATAAGAVFTASRAATRWGRRQPRRRRAPGCPIPAAPPRVRRSGVRSAGSRRLWRCWPAAAGLPDPRARRRRKAFCAGRFRVTVVTLSSPAISSARYPGRSGGSEKPVHLGAGRPTTDRTAVVMLAHRTAPYSSPWSVPSSSGFVGACQLLPELPKGNETASPVSQSGRSAGTANAGAGCRRLWPGKAYPLGATYDGSGTNFAVFSETAESVELCLFDADGAETRVVLPEVDGFVWHGFIPNVEPGQRYGYRVRGPLRTDRGPTVQPEQAAAGTRHAKAIDGTFEWGQPLFGYNLR